MPKHESHPQGELSLRYYKRMFDCDGCKMPGYGERYRCNGCPKDKCDYDLHKECMYLAPTRSLEPFPGRTFTLLDRPPPPARCRACDVCKKDVKGFVYHCKEEGFDVHPLCASLKRRVRVTVDEHGVEFELEPGMQGKCYFCNKSGLGASVERIPGFCYMSSGDEVKCTFHVYCLMTMLIKSAAAARKSTVPVSEEDHHRGSYDRLLDDEVPVLERRMVTYNDPGSSRGRTKLFRVVKMFLKAVLPVLFGDPTAIIVTSALEGLEEILAP